MSVIALSNNANFVKSMRFWNMVRHRIDEDLYLWMYFLFKSKNSGYIYYFSHKQLRETINISREGFRCAYASCLEQGWLKEISRERQNDASFVVVIEVTPPELIKSKPKPKRGLKDPKIAKE